MADVDRAIVPRGLIFLLNLVSKRIAEVDIFTLAVPSEQAHGCASWSHNEIIMFRGKFFIRSRTRVAFGVALIMSLVGVVIAFSATTHRAPVSVGSSCRRLLSVPRHLMDDRLSDSRYQSPVVLTMVRDHRSLKFVPCLHLHELPRPGSATSCRVGDLSICIAVNDKGSVYALDDSCPPLKQSLSQGKVEAHTIVDPVLGTKFSLKTGEVVDWCPAGLGKLIGGAFKPENVRTYSVRQRGGVIEVGLDRKATVEDVDGWGVFDDSGNYT